MINDCSTSLSHCCRSIGQSVSIRGRGSHKYQMNTNIYFCVLKKICFSKLQFVSLLWFSCHLSVFVYVYAYYFLDIVCVYPYVHSLSLSSSLLPSVPLIPECVTNGRSRCSALLCSITGDFSSVCVHGCVRECMCICVYSSHGGFRSCD